MFSWSTKKPAAASSSSSSSYPGQRPAGTGSPGHSRQDHLTSFLDDPTLKRSTRRVSKDDSTYDTVFQTRSGYALILRIHVATREGVAPNMTVVGVTGTHPWLDAKMRVVGYPPIVSDVQWNTSGMLLSRAVNEVIQHLQLNPPTITSVTDESLKKLNSQQPQQQQQQQGNGDGLRQPSNPPTHMGNPPPPTYESAMQSDDYSPRRDDDAFHIPIPAVPSTFPDVEKMPRSELKDLVDYPMLFNSYIERMPAVTTIGSLQKSITDGNVDQAKSNLGHEEELGALHAEVSALRSDLDEKIGTFRKLEKRQKELCTPEDPRKVLKELHAAKRKAFTSSEQVASDWLDSDDDDVHVDKFLSAFMQKREVFHMRGAKIERLSAQGLR